MEEATKAMMIMVRINTRTTTGDAIVSTDAVVGQVTQ